MMLPAKLRHKGSDLDTNQKLLTVTDKVYHYIANDDTMVQLTIVQQTVIITNNSAFVLVLPSVAEARLLTFIISVANDGNAVTLTDYANESYSDGTSWGGDYTLDAAGDSITLRSDGKSWTVVSNDIS